MKRSVDQLIFLLVLGISLCLRLGPSTRPAFAAQAQESEDSEAENKPGSEGSPDDGGTVETAGPEAGSEDPDANPEEEAGSEDSHADDENEIPEGPEEPEVDSGMPDSDGGSEEPGEGEAAESAVEDRTFEHIDWYFSAVPGVVSLAIKRGVEDPELRAFFQGLSERYQRLDQQLRTLASGLDTMPEWKTSPHYAAMLDKPVVAGISGDQIPVYALFSLLDDAQMTFSDWLATDPDIRGSVNDALVSSLSAAKEDFARLNEWRKKLETSR